jgi:PAS domain S-box-containing protein
VFIDRKFADRALRQSEERHRAVFEQSIDGIALVDIGTGLILDCNQVLGNLVGRRRSELIGQSHTVLHPHEDNIGEFSVSFKEHLSFPDGYVTHTRIMTASLEVRDVEIKSSRLVIRDRLVLQGVFRDITERKAAEHKIQFQAELLNAVGQAILVINSDGVISYWNPAAERLYGWTADEILGQHLRVITVSEAILDKTDDRIPDISAGKTLTGRFWFKRRDGTMFDAIATQTPVVNDRREPATIIGISNESESAIG